MTRYSTNTQKTISLNFIKNITKGPETMNPKLAIRSYIRERAKFLASITPTKKIWILSQQARIQ